MIQTPASFRHTETVNTTLSNEPQSMEMFEVWLRQDSLGLNEV